MASLFERRLLVVTGKGGVGKTTVAAAIGLLAARRGLRAIVVEVGDQQRLAALFGRPEPAGAGEDVQLRDRLWSTSIDPDRALAQWLARVGGRLSARVLTSSSTFQYFAAAAPGARELVSMVKVWEMTDDREHPRGRATGYDLVVLDAPASGHALALLRSPHTFAAITRVGPIASHAHRVRELLEDPARSDYIAVAHGSEMAVTETLELHDALREQLGRELHTVVVNGTLPRRFTAEELQRIASMNGRDPVLRDAASAAATVHDRARVQHNQIARLRRQRFDVVGVPFVFHAELDVAAVEGIAGHLEKL